MLYSSVKVTKFGLVLAALGLGLGSLGAAPASSSTGNGGTPAGSRTVVGCTGGGGAPVTHGPRSRPVVALTFDDGPSAAYTPQILSILNRLHASATFFEEGRHVAGNEALMRQILASGDEIGNHSFDHPRYPGYGELASTNSRIREATGFTPCLFRPPYGLIDANVESAATAHTAADGPLGRRLIRRQASRRRRDPRPRC